MTENGNNVEVGNDRKVLRVVLTGLLCLAVFGAGLLRSYQMGVQEQAANVMRSANDPAALAAAHHQINWAKNNARNATGLKAQ
jgi:anti-sigma regulatory factor (Ser/Thr protein kinase)